MTVYLVGAGPGDPDLLTMAATKLLGRADVVIHDRLIDQRVLDIAAPWAELVDVGKRPGAPVDAQVRINEVLIDRGRTFECVVRLKGGDPFVFGRGGEEALELRAAGIDVEEVPGITSAIAAPAAAGIPVTMRGVSSGVSIVTAHQDPATDRWLDWAALARSGTTLVILMGAARAAQIAEELLNAGLPGHTPVATVRSACTQDQDIRRGVLADLGEMNIENPSTIVVGSVAALDVLRVAESAAIEGALP